VDSYTLEITQRTISPYTEECRFGNEEGHNPEGTGPDCTGDCRWMEGDVRVIKESETFTAEMDDDDAEEYGGPVAWAAHYLSRHHPEISNASSESGSSFADKWQSEMPSHAWLFGESEDVYNPEIKEETTVQLTGDFTPSQRAKVFALAVVDYQRMTQELRERGEG
jgi:hypothetical protein